MRILWLSPWLRPLARVQAKALTRRGHDVLLVTSDQHPESGAARPGELVLRPQPKDVSTWLPFVRAVPQVRRFGADVVVCELVRDPRWMLLAGRTPRVTVVHDDRPHDESERRPRWEQQLFDRWQVGGAAVIAHSRYVADAIGADRGQIVPLTSDLDDDLVPALVTADQRRDFVVVGRPSPYKNLEVTLAAWRAHVEGSGWVGDDLVLIGTDEVPAALPSHVRVAGGRYRYQDVVTQLSRAKGLLVHYRQATQSGVQVLAMQLGVTPIVSPQGALPEYQPVGESAVGVDDVAGVAVRLDELAVPEAAHRRGRAANEHYRRGYGADVAAAAWDTVLTDVIRRAGSTAR